ncbi:MAG: DoxX family protein [Candidatus Taylorbacteria bacterium CG11_big_fil_rev_8_21_14_0_20_46_11]|uniref:DoxX family protein n=1 Tax=Candidatus Taylorbacteria bacterium CG11_big_fil_rev_8_21_14_0_20_46_11 TaxID=1975025 RepID=A0A2H0K9W8_9BACT|nr:MAG: DoxX family protein [Candidatus Taylorbacteria bacterium CG11_big_fil_rev_8_21_14_0_20_46_11]
MDILFLIGRLIFGGYFLMNAWSHFKNLESMTGYAESKGVPSPRSAVFVGGVLLLLGGLGVVFGIAPEASLAVLLIFLVPVTFKMHAFWKEVDQNKKMMERIAFMKNVALIGALLMLYAVSVPWVYNALQ